MAHEHVKMLYVDVILEHAAKVELAIDRGPEATEMALMNYIEVLDVLRESALKAVLDGAISRLAIMLMDATDAIGDEIDAAIEAQFDDLRDAPSSCDDPDCPECMGDDAS